MDSMEYSDKFLPKMTDNPVGVAMKDSSIFTNLLMKDV